MKKSYFLLSVGVIVLILTISSCTNNSKVNEDQGQQIKSAEKSEGKIEKTMMNGMEQQSHTIEILSTGFKPNELKMRAGDSVIFVNKDTNRHWPASGIHPTHTVYPEPGGCVGSKFDSCKNLLQGESFTFIFGHKGIWKYHDHSNPALWGTIVVE